MKRKSLIMKVMSVVALCSILSGSIYYNVGTEKAELIKQYVIISDTDGSRGVDTYKMTFDEALKLKNSDPNILVVAEEGYVTGSKVKEKNNLNNFKAEKKQNNKKVVKKSAKDSDTEWNIQEVNAEDVQTWPGPKVKVAIIDSGINLTSDVDVYMRKNFIPGEDEVLPLYEDISGHGTSVSGIIAAKDNIDGITGINPNVELYSAKVLEYDLTAPISRIAEAIYWAIDQKVNIINMSFGTTTDSEVLRQAIQDANDAGILIIAAAGNHGVVEYPAAYDGVIAVGSVDSKGNHSKGSAEGDALDLVAPGEQILSTGAFDGMMTTTGTSMSAPHVTAIASVLWQRDLSRSSDFIRTLLEYSANKYGDSKEYGFGLVDLKFALNQYDKFKAIYDDPAISVTISEVVANGSLEENQSEVDSFDDVPYVEGNWYNDTNKTSKTHAYFITQNPPLSGNNLSILLAGASAPDTIVGGMTTYPMYHGYYINTDGSNNNYMSSYLSILNIASAAYNGAFASMPYLSSTNFGTSTINSLISQATNNQIPYPIAPQRAIYIYGIAIHSATDIFAHSTAVNGYRIKHTTNSNNGLYYADDPNHVPNRWACATKMAQNVISYMNNGTYGSVSDFLSVSSVYDQSFKVINYSLYASQINSSVDTSAGSFLSKINISSASLLN